MSYGDSLAVEERIEGKIPVIGSGGVSGWHNRYNFDGPGIVIGRKGSYGSIHWVETDGFAIDTAYFINKSTTSVDLRWLFFVLQAIDLKGPSQDVGVPGLSREAAYAQLVPSPPSVEEQRRIADFLDAEIGRLDRLIEATERQLKLLHERQLEAFRMLTTDALSAGSVETGISWMPAMGSQSTLLKIGREFSTGSGTTPRASDEQYFGEGSFWVNTGDLRDGVVLNPAKTVTAAARRDYSTLKIYDPGSLVVAMYGATTGRVGILGVPACVNQACCVLGELGRVSSHYLFYWFRAHRQEILALASGGGQPNISQELIRSLRVPVPPREMQDFVVEEAKRVETAISQQQSLLQDRSRLLAERRQALITAVVTGQFDVTTASGRNLTQGV